MDAQTIIELFAHPALGFIFRTAASVDGVMHLHGRSQAWPLTQISLVGPSDALALIEVSTLFGDPSRYQADITAGANTLVGMASIISDTARAWVNARLTADFVTRNQIHSYLNSGYRIEMRSMKLADDAGVAVTMSIKPAHA